MFSGTGKNGPETGLQYSVRLNQATMDSLLLKVTPMKGHGINNVSFYSFFQCFVLSFYSRRIVRVGLTILWGWRLKGQLLANAS